MGDRKGKEQANPAEKQRARVRKRERGEGTVAVERIAREDTKTEKNGEMPRERGRPGKDKGIRKRKVACEKNT